MTAIYMMLSVSILLSLSALAVGFAVLKRSLKNSGGVSSDELLRLDNDIKQTVQMENRMIVGTMNAQASNTKELAERFDKFMVNMDAKFDRMRMENAAELEKMHTSNASELEKLRGVVDEKLSATLDQRFTQSFKIVNDRLEEINKEFAEIQNLQTSVKDLNGIFRNVKTRGTWGEVALQNLLEQILAPEQYERQAQVARGEDSRVDFAIKMPGKGDGSVLLPLDAKFPIEDYQRLVEASSAGNKELTDAAVKALGEDVLKQARSIRDKYIRPPKTTDFAVMYLPVEGLYAEIVKQTGTIEKLQAECRVVVCGPTTLAALLNSLQMGFRSVAIEKRSVEIGKMLTQFQKQFIFFSKYLSQLKEKMQRLQTTVEDAEKKSDRIGTQLSKVTKLGLDDGDENEILSGLAAIDAGDDITDTDDKETGNADDDN